jgi:hypothetical protein
MESPNGTSIHSSFAGAFPHPGFSVLLANRRTASHSDPI